MRRSLRVSLCLAVALFGAETANARPHRMVVSGAARVIDGDTLAIGRVRVRLYGVDAFEHDQTCGAMACGEKASSALKGLVNRKSVSCERQDIDHYGRWVAICKSGDVDLGREMVRRGLAVAYRYFSLKYAADEDWARAHRQGAWAFGFEDPYDWRQAHR
ncbi:MAG: thermonuclease family protein [Asticcacaulis sp.]|nr:thermonuclease family protein [Asticcacaulis sp.]